MENSIKQIDIELAATDTKHLQNVLTAQQNQIAEMNNTINELKSTIYTVMAQLKDHEPEQDSDTGEWLSWNRVDD